MNKNKAISNSILNFLKYYDIKSFSKLNNTNAYYFSSKYSLASNNIHIKNNILYSLINTNKYSFAKKQSQGGNTNSKKEQQKEKSKQEKSQLNQQYENLSQEDVTNNYNSQSKEIVDHYYEELSKIMSLRISNKMFESVNIILKHEKRTLNELATVNMKGSNIININPFDEDHKDNIIKALQTTNLDLQIQSEGNNIISVVVGPIPKEIKLETINKYKRLESNLKEEIKKLRHNGTSEAKKLEKITGKDSARKLEKNILDVIDKNVKRITKDIQTKIEEINSL